MFKNPTNECCDSQSRVHIVIVRNIRARIGLRPKMYEKHSRIWSKVDHCNRVWYSNSQTCFRQSVRSRSISSLVPLTPCLTWQCMWGKSHGSNVSYGRQRNGLYHVSTYTFSLFSQEYGFVVRCNIFYLCIDTLALKKCRIYKGI